MEPGINDLLNYSAKQAINNDEKESKQEESQSSTEQPNLGRIDNLLINIEKEEKIGDNGSKDGDKKIGDDGAAGSSGEGQGDGKKEASKPANKEQTSANNGTSGLPKPTHKPIFTAKNKNQYQ